MYLERYSTATACAVLVLAASGLSHSAFAAGITLPTPPGSGTFGSSVTALPNRNFVVTDSGFDDPLTGVANVGAAHLFGPDGDLISTLRGSTANDAVARKIIVLANGNFLVASPFWGSLDQGAVTFCRADVGCDGVVSAANSLVGSQNADGVGTENRIFPLTNGNYVVATSVWDNGPTVNAGAVTWGSGITGINGPVSIANSLVGSSTSDTLGNGDMLALSNGNYVVISPFWDDALNGFVNTGAITFGNGMTGISGPVSALNSFTCGVANGSSNTLTAVALTNGNYVISQPAWRTGPLVDVGAATFASGTTGLIGTANPGNSLVGSNAGDRVGLDVKPFVSADRKYVTMEFRPGLASVTFFTELLSAPRVIGTGDGGGVVTPPLPYPIELPNVAIDEVSTTIIVPDKGILMVGGFNRAIDQQTSAKVPFLGHIPYLGRLFGTRGRFSERLRLYLLAAVDIIDYREAEENL